MLLLLFCHGAFAWHILADGTPQLSAEDLVKARRLYRSKCSRCHKFYEPASYDERSWGEWMEKMRKKSKLKREQFDLIERYTESLRQKMSSSSSNPASLSKQRD